MMVKAYTDSDVKKTKWLYLKKNTRNHGYKDRYTC